MYYSWKFGLLHCGLWGGGGVTLHACYICLYFIYLSLSVFNFLDFFFTVFVHLLNIPYSTEHSTLRQTENMYHVSNVIFSYNLILEKNQLFFCSCFVHTYFEFWDFLTVMFFVICKCFYALKFFSVLIFGGVIFISWKKFWLLFLFI